MVAGNWKMNKNLQEGIELAKSINSAIINEKQDDVEVVICAPFTHLNVVYSTIDNNSIKIGAQNCSNEKSGAYTGEVSAEMIKSSGAEYVIIGHSERRSYFGENNELLSKKVDMALQYDLKVIFCCGEVLGERESDNYFNVVSEQIEKGLFHLSENQFSNVTIAYEPVWAIGTGITASSDQAQEMHKFIRKTISRKYGEKVANELTILYGGSCNAINAKELFAMEDVDGGLIGGASLKTEDFCSIIKSF